MRKIALLVCAASLGAAWIAFAQEQAAPPPAQAPAKLKTGSTGKAGTPAVRTAYDRTLLRPALLTATAPENYQVRFTTTRGDFVISVSRAWAPLGADRFYNLVRHHYYDNASFFRVVPGFVVQFGISAYPPISAAWSNANIKDDPVKQSNTKGFVTYAMGGPNTRTTQVFVNLRDNSRLDRDGFAPFGQVTEGMDVVEALYDQYGDGSDMGGKGPLQGQIEKLGKSYLDKDFPKLDSIKMATVTAPAGATPKAAAPEAKKPE